MQFRGIISRIISAKKKYSHKEKQLAQVLKNILGENPRKIELYKEAFSLKGMYRGEKNLKNYERLEFLGDAVLGGIISHYLFKQYPYKNEGYLTQMKSKIVSRRNLNEIGEGLKLTKYVFNHGSNALGENINGNLFEALIGAMYLDFGYAKCEKIILTRLLPPHKIIELESKVGSYKGVLLEWSQKNKLTLEYDTQEEFTKGNKLSFKSFVLIDNQRIAHASDCSKKKAEEKAAQYAFHMLNQQKQN